jgi:hypothetical protein
MRFLRNRRKPLAVMAACALFAATLPAPAARADLVSTERMLSQPSETPRERLRAFLAREDVRSQLRSLGVSPREASDRVASLSDEEVERVTGHLDSLPAGQGAFGAIVGAAVLVFLVLLITDLLGLTHVFGFTKKGSLNPEK